MYIITKRSEENAMNFKLVGASRKLESSGPGLERWPIKKKSTDINDQKFRNHSHYFTASYLCWNYSLNITLKIDMSSGHFFPMNSRSERKIRLQTTVYRIDKYFFPGNVISLLPKSDWTAFVQRKDRVALKAWNASSSDSHLICISTIWKARPRTISIAATNDCFGYLMPVSILYI